MDPLGESISMFLGFGELKSPAKSSVKQLALKDLDKYNLQKNLNLINENLLLADIGSNV